MTPKKVVDSEEDSDSDSEIIANANIKTEVKKKVDNSSEGENEDDDEEGMVYNSFTNPSNARSDGRFTLDFKLQLINEIKNANKRKTSTFKVALRHFDWSTINIEGYTIDDMKNCLEEIIKPICSVRTMDEMLTDYEMHHQKFDLKMHPDAPKVPRNAVMKFIDDNRVKLKKTLSKKFPGTIIGLKEISSYGAKKFSALSDNEQERYKLQYRTQLKEYAEKKAILFQQYPELVKKRARTKTGKNETANERVPNNRKRKRPELPYITPFMVFREELGKEGNDVSYHDAQALYKNMADEDKMKYIQSLLVLDTPLEKQFSSHERKIIKFSNGMPQRPLSSYNLFVKELCKEASGQGKKELLKISSIQWKVLDPEKKEYFESINRRELDIWEQKMKDWMKTLPIEQQVEQMAKHGFLSKTDASRKRRRNTTVIGDDGSKKITTDFMSFKKEEPKENPVINFIKSKNDDNNLNDEPLAHKSEEPPKKKKRNADSDLSSVESSPKKKKFKDISAVLGTYPSLKTAHFFMAHKYIGKPQKVSKAYSKLNKVEKKKIYEEMKKAKAEYFGKLKKYVEENPKDAEKVRQFHAKNRQEQEESVIWHKACGTDQSDSDSDDDSDDSDSS